MRMVTNILIKIYKRSQICYVDKIGPSNLRHIQRVIDKNTDRLAQYTKEKPERYVS